MTDAEMKKGMDELVEGIKKEREELWKEAEKALLYLNERAGDYWPIWDERPVLVVQRYIRFLEEHQRFD